MKTIDVINVNLTCNTRLLILYNYMVMDVTTLTCGEYFCLDMIEYYYMNMYKL